MHGGCLNLNQKAAREALLRVGASRIVPLGFFSQAYEQLSLPFLGRFLHRTRAVDPVERRQVWRGRFLQAVSRARGQQQSGESGGRSDEEQSCKFTATLK